MSCCSNFYRGIICFGRSLKSPLLLVIRLIWGFGFMKAGYAKLSGIPAATKFFASVGIIFPEFSAYLVGIFEFLGGFALVFGLASRMMSIPLIIIMIVAYATAHTEAFVNFADQPGAFMAEDPFNFLLASLIILTVGPGKYSVDHYVSHKGGDGNSCCR